MLTRLFVVKDLDVPMTFTVLNQFASLNISTTQSCYSNFNVFVIFKLMMLSALLALCVISLPGDFPRKGPVMRRNLDFCYSERYIGQTFDFPVILDALTLI